MTRRLWLLLAAGILIPVAGIIFAIPNNWMLPFLFGYYALMMIIVLIDGLHTPRKRQIGVSRQAPPYLEQAHPASISIVVNNRSDRKLQVWAIEAPMLAGEPPLRLTIQPAQLRWEAFPGITHQDYEILLYKRGRVDFQFIYVRCLSALGLFYKQMKVSAQESLDILPDMQAMRQYGILAQKRLLDQQDGRHKVMGIGTDFVNLREYTQDDEFRKINWKATARQCRLISNVYDVEKDRNVMICIDCGRQMLTIADGYTRLDHCISAALALAQVAIYYGDRVGVLAYSATTLAFVPPDKGGAQMRQIIRALAGVQPQFTQSDPGLLTTVLTNRLKKRALVVSMGHFEDMQQAKDITKHYRILSKRHAVLSVSMLSPGLQRALHAPIMQAQDIYVKGAGAYRIEQERNAAQYLHISGADSLTVFPAELTAQMVNHFLSMRKRMRV